MQADIEAVRYDPGDGEKIDLPVKLKVHDSIFVPLAKWAMLLTGNYRCVTADGAIDIKDAVHADPENSRSVYNWVMEVCEKLGASPERPGAVREIRRRRATGWCGRPRRRARSTTALPNIERTDRLVQLIARSSACATRPSTRPWRRSTRGSRPTARRPPPESPSHRDRRRSSAQGCRRDCNRSDGLIG